MLTCVILAKNEEKTIEKAIKSVKFADEILVVDDDSTDKTAVTAVKAGATILTHTLSNNFAAQRNYALEKAAGEWVLFLDADEEITPELKKNIVQIVKKEKSEFAAYYLKRRDKLWGRELKHGELASAYNKGIIRLVKKSSGTWVGTVHEEFRPTGQTGQLTGFINHTPHQSFKDFLEDVNNYSTIRAQELYDIHKKTNVLQIMFYPIIKFKYTYFLKMGFLDGPEGFSYSFMMSFHSFLVRSKLYMLWQKSSKASINTDSRSGRE